MITYIKGNIFDSPAQVITNTVNTVGVMGKGIALEYKKKYPGMYKEYKNLCDEKKLDVGQLALWRGKDKWVLLFPTKKHWRNPSKIEYIEAGLKKFCDVWDILNIDSIAFPRLGCGNGGLNWADVKALMEKYLKKLPINILIYVDNYEAPRKDLKEKSEIEKWINGNSGLRGFSLFRNELARKISADTLIQQKYGTRLDGSRILLDGEVVDDDELLNLWHMIETSGIVRIDEAKDYEHMPTLLKLMGAIDRTKMVYASKDGEFETLPNAYQYIPYGDD